MGQPQQGKAPGAFPCVSLCVKAVWGSGLRACRASLSVRNGTLANVIAMPALPHAQEIFYFNNDVPAVRPHVRVGVDLPVFKGGMWGRCCNATCGGAFARC